MKYLQLVKAIDSASQQLLGRAASAVNQALVIRNWLIGAYIVEFATSGMDNRLFVSRYLVALPSAEQLQRFVETYRARVEAAIQQHSRARAKPAAAKSGRKMAKQSRRR